MNFIKAFRMLRTTLPFFKSVFQAYKETVGANRSDDSIFNRYFSKVMTQSNLGAPPITESTALQILNIEKNLEEVEPRLILERYYTLFKKNDPKVGGTTYLQSKVYAAKECLMARFPDAESHEQLFYKEVKMNLLRSSSPKRKRSSRLHLQSKSKRRKKPKQRRRPKRRKSKARRSSDVFVVYSEQFRQLSAKVSDRYL